MAKTKGTGTAVAKYSEALAKYAKTAAKQAPTTGGQFISVRGGQIMLDGKPVPGNHLAVVVIGWCLEHAFYEGKFDMGKPSSPVCFAFGQEAALMAPHEASSKRQADKCSICEKNKFGSGDNGKSKACKNVVRLSMLSAGTLDKTGKFEAHVLSEDYADQEPRFFRVPVTSVKNWAKYVANLERVDERPPFAVFTKWFPVPDPTSQFRIEFVKLGDVPDDLAMTTLLKRHEESMESIGFPYLGTNEEQEAPAKKSRKF